MARSWNGKQTGLDAGATESGAQRRSEVGVRMALVASNRSVLRLIVSQGMRPVIIGLMAGTAGALWLSRAMSTLLFDMSAAD
jgi:putative ABC transport system permease protein